jgi:hypothetical protein
MRWTVVAIVAFAAGMAAAGLASVEQANCAIGPTLYVARDDVIVRPATGMARTSAIGLVGALVTLALVLFERGRGVAA